MAHHKPIDNTKYCYYNNLEYSVGAVMRQADTVMKCVRSENKDAEKSTLIWRERAE
ncbi:DUF1496 domain-containing protein [Marinicella sp. W31]|uniref:DUF1496 domain-containing protein n=1 Tax=Marinicella sp. W31 TaxID=3023713 RepID=UPI0037567836